MVQKMFDMVNRLKWLDCKDILKILLLVYSHPFARYSVSNFDLLSDLYMQIPSDK